jgi:hypothetical protein
MTYFIRPPQNEILKDMIKDDRAERWVIGRGPGSRGNLRFPLSSAQLEEGALVVCKIECHSSVLFTQVGFIVTNFRLSSKEVVKNYNGGRI